MPLDLEVNPTGIEAAYLSGLNRCFAGWGGSREYHWEFDRAVGAPSADLLVLREAGAIVAGSAVVYRIIRTAHGDSLVGIMSGSWTLPEARGQGAFSRAIEESRRLVDRRGGDALLAFVTHDNTSRRRLVAAGSHEVATRYLFSGADTPPPAEAPRARSGRRNAETLYQMHLDWAEDAGRAESAHPVYPSAADWNRQYLDRPLPVEHLTVGGSEALVERATTSDRILWVVGPDQQAALAGLLKRALDARRQLFLFTLEAHLAEAALALGLQMKPGSLTVLPSSEGARPVEPPSELTGRWRIQGGDRA